MRNAVIVVTAVAVLVVGFVLVQSAEDGGSSTPAATSVEQASTPEQAPEATGATAQEEEAPKPKPKPAVPTVVFEGGAPKGGVRRLKFDEGDQVRFRVRSDVADEIHVHGFDEYADVEAGKAVTIAFKARFDGAYEVEMHGSGTQVATLEIQP